MIIDTLIIVVCLAVDTPRVERKPDPVLLDWKQMELQLDSAMKEAAKCADKKFRREIERITDTSDIRAIVDKLKRDRRKRP